MNLSVPLANRMVGVIGGMGPAATVELMRRVVLRTPASDDIDHLHLLVDQNPKVPSRIDALVNGVGQSPLPELTKMAKGLQTQGATALVLACNTAHWYADEIAASVEIPLLHMIRLTTAEIARHPLRHRRIGVLASTAVQQLGLYEQASRDRNIEVRYPERQPEILGIIRAVKAQGPVAALRQRFAAVARELYREDIDFLVVACTELSLLAEDGIDDLPVIDSLDVLVAAMLGHAGIQPLDASPGPLSAFR